MDNYKLLESQICSAKDGHELYKSRIEADRKVKQWELAQVQREVTEIKRSEERERREAKRHEELMKNSGRSSWLEVASFFTSIISLFK